MTPTLKAAVVAVVVGFAAAACTTARAAAPVERPTLDVPPPPPRVVVPLPARQPNQLEPVENLGPAPLSVPKPRPQRENSAPRDPKPEDPKPVEPPPVTPPAQEPSVAPQLRLPESSGSPQVSQISDAVGRARGILTRINAESLPPAAKKAHKEATMFADQAEDALKNNNLALAKEFADKAERLARGLQSR